MKNDDEIVTMPTKRQSALSNPVSARRDPKMEKVLVTKDVLQDLAWKAGMTVSYIGDNPIFENERTAQSVRARKFEEKINQLEQANAEQKKTIARLQADLHSERMSAARERIQSPAATPLRSPSTVRVVRAQDVFEGIVTDQKAWLDTHGHELGGTPQDIEAAKELLDWAPPDTVKQGTSLFRCICPDWGRANDCKVHAVSTSVD